MNIKKAKFAGMFYEENPEVLDRSIDEMLSDAKSYSESDKPIKALIVPHAGYFYSGQVAAYAYKLLKDQSFSKIIIIGPSHQAVFDGIITADYDYMETPIGDVKEAPSAGSVFQVYNEAFYNEHNIEVQLPFIVKVLPKTEIIPLLAGYVSDYVVEAVKIEKLLDEKTLLIASSDLSHYLPYDTCVRVDKITTDQITRLDGFVKHDQACGADGINILLEIARKNNWKPKLLKYANSGDITGDKSTVVGYSAFVFY